MVVAVEEGVVTEVVAMVGAEVGIMMNTAEVVVVDLMTGMIIDFINKSFLF